MDCRVTLKRLTEVEIRDAIANSSNDNSGEFETEEDVAVDDFSEDESDHASADEHESSDADYDESEVEDEAVERTDTTTQSTEFVGRDDTTWNESPHAKSRIPRTVIRTSLNKINLLRGQKINSAEIAFDCFFTKQVIETIVMFTNMEGKRVKSDWKEVDDIEIRTFIGLLIAAGVERGSKRNYVEFFDHLRRPPYFPGGNYSNPNRFKSILPGENLTVDEQLIPYRGRCPFKQYIPSKPDKYGMKMFWLCDAATGYPLKGIPYLGKMRNSNLSVGVAHTIVRELCARYERTYRNITTDNYFTSYDLALELLGNGLTLVGTV